MKKNNSSGVTGVIWHKRYRKWQAQMKINSLQKHLGSFSDKFEAICARKSAENRFGFHPNHGMALKEKG